MVRRVTRPRSQARLVLERLEDRSTPSYVPITEFSAGITNASDPTGVAAGPDGNLWFTEYSANRIGRITPTGNVTEFSAGISGGSHPSGIAAGPDGNMWFTEFTGTRIGRITPTGNVTEFSTGISPGSEPGVITAGPDGNLWFAEEIGARIGRITLTGSVTEFSAGINPNAALVGIAAGPDGNLWFAESGGRIGRITPTGTVTEFSAGLTGGPRFITAGADGNLWFTENNGFIGSEVIGRISTAGLVTEFPLRKGATPFGIAAGSDGNLWFTEPDSSRIGQITRAGVVTEFPLLQSGNPTPDQIASGPDGNVWFTDDRTPNSVGKAVLPKPVVTGSDAGGRPLVRVFDGLLGSMTSQFLAYDPRFTGGVRVAQGDVNGDGIPDIITAPGPGGEPDIRVFSGYSGALIREFLAYAPGFAGGVFVAAGDVNGDGRADIITGPDTGGGPDVRVFSGMDNSLLGERFAFSGTFAGGVRVAAADLNHDGKADIIAAAGPSGGPEVRVFSGANLNLSLADFFAYSSSFRGGVFATAGDVNGDGTADIITGPGAGGGPDVRVFNGLSGHALLREFAAFDPAFTGGVRVAAIDVDGDGRADIVAAPGAGGGPDVRIFDVATLTRLDEYLAYDPSFLGGVFVS
jgi:streptogramin lyase